MKLIVTILIFASGLFALSGHAAVGDREIYAKLRKDLAAARTSSDSIKVLYDLYDVAIGSEKKTTGWTLLEVAGRVNNQEVLGDMLPQMAVLEMRNPKSSDNLVKYADMIEDSIQRKAVGLFLDVSKSSYDILYNSEEDLHEVIHKYAESSTNSTTDLFSEICDLYRMVIFLGQTQKGNIYLEYLTQLEDKIEKLPDNSKQLRSLYYTTSANAHTRSGNHQKAIESDRKLLNHIKKLEDEYRAKGRKYRDYSRSYYVCYRRMLRNYKALTPDEVNDLYRRCLELAEQNPEVKQDVYDHGYVTVYKLMSEKNYKEAIPYIKTAMKYVSDESNRNELAGMLVEAASATGDNATLVPALKEYNKILEAEVEENNEAAYHEMQIRFDVNKLKSENMALALEKRDQEIVSRQRIITVGLACLLVMAVILMVLYRNLFRQRRILEELRNENLALHNNLVELLDDGKPDGTMSMDDYKRIDDKQSL